MEVTNSNGDLVFNVAQLLKERVGSTRRFHFDTPNLALDEDPGEGETLHAQDVHGDVKVTRLADSLLVQGDIEAGVLLECSRCLEKFTRPVDARLEEQFLPTIDVETGAPVRREEFEENDLAFEIDPNHLMDLTEPVRQALLVALPMKPLCREDCKGICLQCGANLNETACGHGDEPADNRWTGLRELRIEDFPAGDNVN
ncbi:MAG TPA: DUF177 domain-containing protein [Chloroflexia bacterium]